MHCTSRLLIAISHLLFTAALPLNSPLLPEYDYISTSRHLPSHADCTVVGGGPAGLTVANRLSEDPNITVLLIEAGPADRIPPYLEIPFIVGDGIGGPYD